jgi:hypothetical protein
VTRGPESSALPPAAKQRKSALRAAYNLDSGLRQNDGCGWVNVAVTAPPQLTHRVFQFEKTLTSFTPI